MIKYKKKYLDNAHTLYQKQKKYGSHLKRSYGLSWEDYCKMVEEQDNKCYLCGNPPTDKWAKLVVDHDHRTNKVRKLLCRMCNIHLSRIEACPDYLKRVVEYLNYDGY